MLKCSRALEPRKLEQGMLSVGLKCPVTQIGNHLIFIDNIHLFKTASFPKPSTCVNCRQNIFDCERNVRKSQTHDFPLLPKAAPALHILQHRQHFSPLVPLLPCHHCHHSNHYFAFQCLQAFWFHFCFPHVPQHPTRVTTLPPLKSPLQIIAPHSCHPATAAIAPPHVTVILPLQCHHQVTAAPYATPFSHSHGCQHCTTTKHSSHGHQAGIVCSITLQLSQ